MANISEAIGSIRQAESEADSIIEEAKKKLEEWGQTVKKGNPYDEYRKTKEIIDSIGKPKKKRWFF